jgi:hypothetical protein
MLLGGGARPDRAPGLLSGRRYRGVSCRPGAQQHLGTDIRQLQVDTDVGGTVSPDHNYGPRDRARDSRMVEWMAAVLRRYGDLFCRWEESRGAGWVELEYAVGNVVLHAATAASGRALLLLEAIEAYSRLGREIERQAKAAIAALDRLRSGRIR